MKIVSKYTFLLLLMVVTSKLISQNNNSTVSNAYQSDTILTKSVVLDSSYLYRDIIQLVVAPDYFGSQIEIDQKSYVKQKLNNYIANASKRVVAGYRIRIFFNNNQQARARSEQLVYSFSQLHPDTGVYRTYDNPYFKVTVGDLRTKSDAVKMLKQLEREYPSAFIVRENINFPPL